MQTEEGARVLGKILNKIGELADCLGLINGYRLVINQGDDAGQTVHHLHIHIIGGEKLKSF
jgi:histidine triad (HIT) family protein